MAGQPDGTRPAGTWTWFGLDAEPVTAYDAGASDGDPVVICRIRHRRDVEVGQLTNGLCLIGGEGIARPYSGFEILQALPGARWASPDEPDVSAPVEANAGRGPSVTVCRMEIDGGAHVGMVRGDLCSAGRLPDEITSDHFQILTSTE